MVKLIFSSNMSQPKITPKTGARKLKLAISLAGYIDKTQNHKTKPTETIPITWNANKKRWKVSNSLINGPKKSATGIKINGDTAN